MYRQEMLLMPDTDPSWTTLSSASSLTTTEHHSQQQLQLQQPSSISGGNNINDISRHSSSINCENSLNSRGANLQSFGVNINYFIYSPKILKKFFIKEI